MIAARILIIVACIPFAIIDAVMLYKLTRSVIKD